jgi:hypothetical protein
VVRALLQTGPQIVIEFRMPPVSLFRAMAGCRPCTNVLTIALQPDEGFDLSFEVKTPGEPFQLQTEHMKFRYPHAFGELSADNTTQTWTSTNNPPITNKPAPMREIARITGDNTRTLDMFGKDPKSGVEYQMMHMEFTRRSN